jgi:hypothetical protein
LLFLSQRKEANLLNISGIYSESAAANKRGPEPAKLTSRATNCRHYNIRKRCIDTKISSVLIGKNYWCRLSFNYKYTFYLAALGNELLFIVQKANI